jgi:hypothetical protein
MKEQDYAVRRTEDRVGVRVTALLVGGHEKVGVETGLTENVSSRGARVISTSEWSRDETSYSPCRDSTLHRQRAWRIATRLATGVSSQGWNSSQPVLISRLRRLPQRSSFRDEPSRFHRFAGKRDASHSSRHRFAALTLVGDC